MTIAVAGCVAQAEGEEIMRRQPAVDLVVGPQAYHQLPELIARTRTGPRGERLGADFAPDEKFDALPAERRRHRRRPPSSPCRRAATSSAPSAWCPTRAARNGRGRPPTSLAEARDLAEQGVREVTLLGQNVNAYDGEDADGAGLWPAWSGGWRRSRAWTASATRPAIRATWTTT